MKNYALFSNNGRFIGFTNFKPANGLYKEMPESFDPVMQVYAGDYETGGLKHISALAESDYQNANIDKKKVLFESELNEEGGRQITQEQRLPLYKQLNLIMEVIYNNRDKIAVTKEFEDAYNTITEIRQNIANTIETSKQESDANVVEKENEKLYFEEYTQKQLNINDEPVDVQVTN